jgi:uncharacterized membrane protein YhaH (DUF805 family)
MGWMFMPLRRFADFSGRSRRKEYWLFQLLIVGLSMIIWGYGSLAPANQDSALIKLLLMPLVFIIPSLAVQFVGYTTWASLVGGSSLASFQFSVGSGFGTEFD